jgi:hypothetical protein
MYVCECTELVCGAYVSRHCVVMCGEYVTSHFTHVTAKMLPQRRLQTNWRKLTVEVRFLCWRNEAIVIASEVADNSYSAIP